LGASNTEVLVVILKIVDMFAGMGHSGIRTHS